MSQQQELDAAKEAFKNKIKDAFMGRLLCKVVDNFKTLKQVEEAEAAWNNRDTETKEAFDFFGGIKDHVEMENLLNEAKKTAKGEPEFTINIRVFEDHQEFEVDLGTEVPTIVDILGNLELAKLDFLRKKGAKGQ